MTNKRREYTREFKLEAISLVIDHKRKIAEIAESLGIGVSTLDNWVRKYRLEQQGVTPTTGLALTDEQRELQALRKQVRRLTMGATSKGLRSASLGQSERLSLISNLAEQDKRLSKRKLCDLFDVVRSSYYYGVQAKPINIETVKLKALIRQIFNESKQSAGTRTIITTLWHQHGVRLTRYRAGKLMRGMGLKSCQFKTHKYKHADQEHKTHDNVLDRNFSPSTPNQVWTGT